MVTRHAGTGGIAGRASSASSRSACRVCRGRPRTQSPVLPVSPNKYAKLRICAAIPVTLGPTSSAGPEKQLGGNTNRSVFVSCQAHPASA